MKTFKIMMMGLTAVLLLTTSVFAQGKTGEMEGKVFYVNDPVGRNAVTFESTAPLEDIVGTTSDVKGHLIFDPQNPENGGKGELVVTVASLNTGIPLRDEHLRSADWMSAETNPHITFKIDKVSDVKLVKETDAAVTYDVTAHGNLTINGKTKSVSVPGRITYLAESEMTKNRLPGDILAVRASFDVALADFGITGPANAQIIGAKVGEIIAVELSIMGSTKSEAPEMASTSGK
jgi:polyisoprenoid-binding protein YceI